MTSIRVDQSASLEVTSDQHLDLLPLRGNGSGLRLVGELDLCCVDELAAALTDLSVSDGEIVLELGDLEFIDIAGTRLLVQTGMHLHEREGRLRLRHASPFVRDVLGLFLDPDDVPVSGDIELPLNGSVRLS
jgi:anti-anti-sigma factor